MLLGQGAIPGKGALYPWAWVRSEKDSFAALQGIIVSKSRSSSSGASGVSGISDDNNKGIGSFFGLGSITDTGYIGFQTKNKQKQKQKQLLVAPILQKLILNREPSRVLQWADRVSDMGTIKRIIPAHFENNLRGPDLGLSFRRAFSFLETPIYLDSDDYRAYRASNASASVGGERGVRVRVSGLMQWMSLKSGNSKNSMTKGREGAVNRNSNRNRNRNRSGAAATATNEDLALLDAVSDVFTKLNIVAPKQN